MKASKEDSIHFKPQKNSSLMLGIIFFGVLAAVLFLLLRSEQTVTKIDEAIVSQEERLTNIEKQILLFDEVKANDSILTDLSLDIKKNHNYAKEQIEQALWPNIQKILKDLKEIDDSIATLNVDINELILSAEKNKTELTELETNLNILEDEQKNKIDLLSQDIKKISRRLLLMDESVQALEGYRSQNNQALQDIQNAINNIENSIVDIQSDINTEDIANDNSIDE
tara:strand:+ start:688 stop:1365 length:678 start_codon:yes stop_codon:yes gene_type:complete